MDYLVKLLFIKLINLSDKLSNLAFHLGIFKYCA